MNQKKIVSPTLNLLQVPFYDASVAPTGAGGRHPGRGPGHSGLLGVKFAAEGRRLAQDPLH